MQQIQRLLRYALENLGLHRGFTTRFHPPSSISRCTRQEERGYILEVPQTRITNSLQFKVQCSFPPGQGNVAML